MTRPGAWPELPSDRWHDTLETVHMWAQIIGKIRMVSSPWLNHSWSVPLYVSSRGLSTSLVPHGTEAFELDFDFLAHELRLSTSTQHHATIELRDGLSVADFYAQVMGALETAGLPVKIYTTPSEVAGAIPFETDTRHASYDREQIHTLWRALLASQRVFSRFRAHYLGKSSPVHFFWGSFDLAVTRFSGETAPAHGGGLPNFPLDVAREAYSHEVTSVGFWPGNREAPEPIFYAYAYPSPDGFSSAKVQPEAATWLDLLGEFVLPYQAVASADDPEAALMSFLESTHAAAADLLGWDRRKLECANPHGPDWWHQRPHED